MVSNGYDITKLSDVMQTLMGPNGCPWDKEQTHESIRKNLIEETYEVVDTIDKKDSEHMKEELGDLLLQVLFHAMIAEKNGEFTFSEMVDGISEKLIRRHPHIYGEVLANNTNEVLTNWEEIKRKEKGEAEVSIMGEIPNMLPALIKAQKVQDKAKRVGFDFNNLDEAFLKVDEEINEVKEAIENSLDIEDELGDVLFSVVNVARFLKLDAEKSLNNAINKFILRFKYLEMKARLDKRDICEYTIKELDAWWAEAKSVKYLEHK